MGTPDHLTCLLRNLYAGQEATVRNGHGTKDWFKVGKGVYQGCILLLCLFNLYAEYIMGNTGLDELQTGIKTAGRNINNLKYGRAFLIAQLVKNPSAIQKTWLRSLGWQDPLEKGKATHSSILAWRIAKSLGTVSATMKLKDVCSLGKKTYDKT